MNAPRPARLASLVSVALALTAIHCGSDDDIQLVPASGGSAGQSSGGRGGSAGTGGAAMGGTSQGGSQNEAGKGGTSSKGGSGGSGAGGDTGEGGSAQGGAGGEAVGGKAGNGQGGSTGGSAQGGASAGGAGIGGASQGGGAGAGQAGEGGGAQGGNAGAEQGGNTQGGSGGNAQGGEAGAAAGGNAGASQGGNAQGGNAQGGNAQGGSGGKAGAGGAVAGPPRLLVAELRTRGSNGGSDEFVEIYNPTDFAVQFDDRWALWARPAVNGCPTASLRFSGPSTPKTIPAHGSLLLASSGYDDGVKADGTLSLGISDAGSVFLTYNGGVHDTLCFAYDQTGFNRFITCGFTCEGTPVMNGPHNDTGAPASNADVSLSRKQGAAVGELVDTGDNNNDFAAVASSPRNLAAGPLP